MKRMRILELHAVVSTTLLAALFLSSAGPDGSATFDELTVKRIHVVDSEGRERVSIAGEFPPRRKELAGLLFHNENGTEAGGLVYYGRPLPDGGFEAGGLMTFDQFGEDQVMSIEYAHTPAGKQNGLRILDRPDGISPQVLAYYRKIEAAQDSEERARLQRELRQNVPPEELSQQRLWVGRDQHGRARLNLCDAAGRTRLRLAVSPEGEAAITFLDEKGEAVRTLGAE